MEPSSDLGPIEAVRRRGDEPFHDGPRNLGPDLTDFWRWGCSDLVSNATRGVLAEYLVAHALGVADGVREEWAAYDLTAADGLRIEVKSAAHIQSWHQERLSPSSFRVPKTRSWDRESNRQGEESRRQAEVYVFAILAHVEQSTLDPLNVSQWEFFVVPTWELDNRTRSQHSIALTSLRALAGAPVTYADLPSAVRNAGERQRKLAGETMPGAGG